MSKGDKAQIVIGVLALVVALVALSLHLSVYLKARKLEKSIEGVVGGDYDKLRAVIAQAIINTIPAG